MKKILLLFAVVLLLPETANAENGYAVIDNIKYWVNTESRTAGVEGDGGKSASGDVVIPAIINYKDIPCVVTSIGYRAFKETNITSVRLPNTLKSIFSYAFYNCTNLSYINFPDSLKTIDSFAFYYCSNLRIPIIIPDKVTNIGEHAFTACGMTSFSTKICPYSGFDKCNNLTEVVYREGITSIRGRINECRKLKTLIIPGTVEEINIVSLSSDYLEDIYCFTSDMPVITEPGVVGAISPSNMPVSTETSGNMNWITVHVKNEAIKSKMDQDDKWSAFTITVMEEHSLTYFVDGEVYKSHKHYYRDTIIPEPAPQRGRDIFSGWSEIPAYMPDCEYNVYGTFTKYVEVNLIIVEHADVFCGTTDNIEFGLQNESADLTAYQFDLTLPSGFDIAKNKKGKPDVILSDRYENDDHSLSVEELGNGKYRFVCVSLTNSTIEGTEGPLMTLALQVASDVAEGSYIANIENIVLTHVDGTKQKTDPVSFTLTVSTYIRGDANGDFEIDVADVVAIVNYILEKPGADFVFKAADADEDGEVDVADAVKVVSMILAQVSNNAPQKRIKKMKQAQTQAGDGLYVDDFSIDEGEKMPMSLKLKNAIDYCSFQCDLFLPDGLTIALNKKGKPDVKLDDDRIDDHTLSVEHASNGSYRLVCTSLSNAAFYENDGPIVNIMVEPVAEFPSGIQEGHIENVRLVEPNGTKHKDFATSTFKVSFGTTTHIDVVKTSNSYDVYNLQGVKVRTNGSTNELPKGLYIINGEKTFVK